MQPLSYALLATQAALLKAVTPELRAVIVDLDTEKHILYIRFYYHGEIAEEIIEHWNCAITEVFADVGEAFTSDEKIERLDYPNKIPFRGRYAYLRKE